MAISFQEFVTIAEASLDRTDTAGMTIRRERDPRNRRKSPAEIKRTKTIIDPKGERKTVPVIQQTRRDAGGTREAGKTVNRQEQPTQERGSADVRAKAAAAAKAERAAKARARIAARKSGGSTESQPSSSSSRDLESAATKLITKKKEEKPEPKGAPKNRRDYGDEQLTTKEKKQRTDAERNQQQTAARQAMAPFVRDYIAKAKAAAKREGRPWKAADSVRARAAAKAAYSKQN